MSPIFVPCCVFLWLSFLWLLRYQKKGSRPQYLNVFDKQSTQITSRCVCMSRISSECGLVCRPMPSNACRGISKEEEVRQFFQDDVVVFSFWKEALQKSLLRMDFEDTLLLALNWCLSAFCCLFCIADRITPLLTLAI